MAAQTFG